MKRFAIVDSNTALEDVQQYLPRNYTASIDEIIGKVVISGEDDHGWTLDGYVIPRLGSGLIAAHEVGAITQRD